MQTVEIEIKKNEQLSPRLLIDRFEEMLAKAPGCSIANAKSELGLGCKYRHRMMNGLYVREMFLPKGVFFVTKIHKTLHPFFLLEGIVTVYSEETGMVRMKAPYSGVTKPGTKRALYTNENTVWVTVHATEKTDIEQIGKDILADSYDDPDLEEAKKEEVTEVIS